jgi:hypothetical protein
MKSLYNKEHCQEFVDRINLLTNESAALWGKMDVAQMLSHCQKPLEIASGALVPKTNPIVKLLFGRVAKKNIVSGKAFRKNLPTFPEAKIADKRAFEQERKKLITLVENFQAKGHDGLTRNEHPLFGKMSPSDWDKLEVLHLDHHLIQFGV